MTPSGASPRIPLRTSWRQVGPLEPAANIPMHRDSMTVTIRKGRADGIRIAGIAASSDTTGYVGRGWTVGASR